MTYNPEHELRAISDFNDDVHRFIIDFRAIQSHLDNSVLAESLRALDIMSEDPVSANATHQLIQQEFAELEPEVQNRIHRFMVITEATKERAKWRKGFPEMWLLDAETRETTDA